jgi:hypothetical protein
VSGAQLGSPVTYTGRRTDEETGLYYCLAQHYSPARSNWPRGARHWTPSLGDGVTSGSALRGTTGRTNADVSRIQGQDQFGGLSVPLGASMTLAIELR